jgi:hypothetical protein
MDTTPKSDDKPTGEDKPRGINWLSILGIAVLIILIFLVIWAVMIMNIAKDNPAIKDVSALAPQIEEMQQMTLSQIEDQALVVDAEELGKDPYPYKNRFLIVDGTMSKEESIGVSENIAMNIFSDNPTYKPYILSDAIVAIDITGESEEAAEGAHLRAYGKLLVLNIEDVWTLPIVGPNLKQEFGDVEGMSDRVVFLIAKAVEVVEAPAEMEEEPLPGEMGSEARTPDMEGAADGENAGGEGMEGGEGEDTGGEATEGGDESEGESGDNSTEDESEGEPEAA